VRTDIATLASILGMSETSAREAYRADRLPPGLVVVRVGRRLIVPVEPILRLLGLGDDGLEIRQPAADLRPNGSEAHPGTTAAGPGNQPGPAATA